MDNEKWKSFSVENTGYMLKIVAKDAGITVFLTNLKKLWIDETTNEELHKRFKDLNERFEFNLQESRKQILNLIENVEKTAVSVEENVETVLLCLNGEVASFPVNFEFNLQICDENMFFREITLPLMKTVKLLEQQQNDLCDLLIKKDREINEYMLEKGAAISKKYLITETFDVSTIRNGNKCLMLGIFGASSSTKLFDEEIRTEEPQIKKIKTSPSKDKIKVYSAKTRKNLKGGINYCNLINK